MLFPFFNKAAKLYWLLHQQHCTAIEITSLTLKVSLSQLGCQKKKSLVFFTHL